MSLLPACLSPALETPPRGSWWRAVSILSGAFLAQISASDDKKFYL